MPLHRRLFLWAFALVIAVALIPLFVIAFDWWR